MMKNHSIKRLNVPKQVQFRYSEQGNRDIFQRNTPFQLNETHYHEKYLAADNAINL